MKDFLDNIREADKRMGVPEFEEWQERENENTYFKPKSLMATIVCGVVIWAFCIYFLDIIH